MKSFLSLTLAASMLINTGSVFANSIAVKPITTMERSESLQGLVSKFKHEVYGKGKKVDLAIKDLSSAILDNKFNVSDLQLFVQMNAEPQEVERFNQTLSIAFNDVQDMKDLSSDELAFILQNAMASTNQTGANFMSCKLGLGIGVPLIAVGVIIGIVALVNSTASKEIVTKEYIQKRQNLQTDYLNTKADLELEITTYNSDIVYYKDEIAELQRRISSGNYGAVEVEGMNQSIREYEFYISDANALLGEVQVDLDYFNTKFDADVVAMNQKETSAFARVDEKKANSSKQAIAAGITAALGAGFALGGISDCN